MVLARRLGMRARKNRETTQISPKVAPRILARQPAARTQFQAQMQLLRYLRRSSGVCGGLALSQRWIWLSRLSLVASRRHESR